jgi:hypothetical protein
MGIGTASRLFLNNGMTKDGMLGFFKKSAPYMLQLKIILTGLEARGKITWIEGVDIDIFTDKL